MAEIGRTFVNEDVLNELEARARELLAERRVPGAAIGLLDCARGYVRTFGHTGLENPLEVDGDTLFQIGSTTKTLTATVLARLAEDGALDLDAPVRRYLPDLELADEDAARRVTVRQLTLHTAGWEGDVFADTGDGDDALARYVTALRDVRQVTPLGTLWSYNNAAFCLAGRVIEVVTGESYETAARRLLLEPLGMRHSSFSPREVMLRRFAVGHVVRGDEVVTARPWPVPRSANAAGGLASSVRDQLRYARFHLGDGRSEDGTRVLASETLRSMQAPQAEADLGSAMGLAWRLRDVAGVRVVAHGGATNGQMSSFWLVPELGFAFTVLTNADTGVEVNRALDAWVLERVLGLAAVEPDAPTPTAAELAAYPGSYRATGFGGRLEVGVEGDALRIRLDPGDRSRFTETPGDPPPPFLARVVARDRVRVVDGPLAGVSGEFLRDDDGDVAWFRTGGRLHRREGGPVGEAHED